jgi:hypothetical protein
MYAIVAVKKRFAKKGKLLKKQLLAAIDYNVEIS